MKKITPCLWFDSKAEEAMNFYISIFKNSKILSIMYYGESSPGLEEMVLAVAFEINGHEFKALNGGSQFTFSPAISFFVDCETQEEVDELWGKLSEGGKKNQCGWLDDKFGVSWQIVPTILGEMLQDQDAQKSKKVMEAMMQMDKLDIETLKQAYSS
jgi:predicted 3-demethylubiquinone-9 3-methyltransferase (glyoxalase superfamily)